MDAHSEGAGGHDHRQSTGANNALHLQTPLAWQLCVVDANSLAQQLQMEILD